MHEVDVIVVKAAVAPGAAGRVIYSITLANGHLVTSPDVWPELTTGRIQYDEDPQWSVSDAERVRRQSVDPMVEGLDAAPWDDESYSEAERAAVDAAVAEADRQGWVPCGTVELEHVLT